MFVRCIAVSLVLSVSTALFAQAAPPPPPAETSPAKTATPEKRVCENIVMTGSRLASRRFCGTPAEWREKQLQDRQATEKIQASPCVTTGTSSTGRSSC